MHGDLVEQLGCWEYENTPSKRIGRNSGGCLRLTVNAGLYNDIGRVRCGGDLICGKNDRKSAHAFDISNLSPSCPAPKIFHINQGPYSFSSTTAPSFRRWQLPPPLSRHPAVGWTGENRMTEIQDDSHSSEEIGIHREHIRV